MKVKHLILLVMVGFAVWRSQVIAQVAVNLGSASNFAILGGSAITFTTGGVIITGDIGSYPTTTVTGIGGVTFVTGVDRSLTTSIMTSAKNDLGTAYDSITGQTVTVPGVTAFANNAILTSGVYSIASSTTDITGTLTLNGSANDVFIFKMSSTLITAASSQILLTGGAQASNVFWQVPTSATLGGTSSAFEGNVLAFTSIDLGVNAMMDGRLLAQNGAVTLGGSDTVTAVPEPAATSVLIAGFLGLVVGVRRIRRNHSDRKLDSGA